MRYGHSIDSVGTIIKEMGYAHGHCGHDPLWRSTKMKKWGRNRPNRHVVINHTTHSIDEEVEACEEWPQGTGASTVSSCSFLKQIPTLILVTQEGHSFPLTNMSHPYQQQMLDEANTKPGVHLFLPAIQSFSWTWKEGGLFLHVHQPLFDPLYSFVWGSLIQMSSTS